MLCPPPGPLAAMERIQAKPLTLLAGHQAGEWAIST
jgi:hypothetical protein